jgi:hypothetical protein
MPKSQCHSTLTNPVPAGSATRTEFGRASGKLCFGSWLLRLVLLLWSAQVVALFLYLLARGFVATYEWMLSW